MIKILTPDVINKIAAGEVVERPSSVVKELIENALDANAKNILVEIEKGGKALIKISDDGFGMDEADLKNCVKTHATSKISNINDLYSIKSFGFRGEALSSITSVSVWSIVSKPKGAPHGIELSSEAERIKPSPATLGSTFTIKNLFYNVPARQKFLKTDNTEFSHILSTFIDLALINHKVGFELIHNKKTINKLPATEKWSGRIADLLGKEFLKNLLPVQFETADYKVAGFVSKAEHAERRPKNQYIFINKRAVTDFLILKAVKQAFGSIIMGSEKPNVILDNEIKTNKIDVNVHPRKREVKHEKPQEVFAFIVRAVKEAIGQSAFTPRASFSAPRRTVFTQTGHEHSLRKPSLLSWKPKKTPHEIQRMSYYSAIKTSDEAFAPLEREITASPCRNWRLLGQIHNAYILIENENGLMLIDQHAASERINCEKISKQFEGKAISKQSMIIPESMECSLNEKQLLEDNIKTLNELGFEIEPFGGNTFSIQSVPADLRISNPSALIKDILHEIQENDSKTPLDALKKKIIDVIACKSAVKFGDPLTEEEQYALIETLENTPNNQSCTHGRPISHSISLEDLAKWFKRT